MYGPICTCNTCPIHGGTRRKNPLDTSGIICDFCGGSGVTSLHTHIPMVIGDRMRMQQMSCDTCGQFIANNNIRALVTQAANMARPLPDERRGFRIYFRKIYQLMLDNIINTQTVGPDHIFELQMGRARSLALKCEIRKGHPTLGECGVLAFIEVDIGNKWQRSCLICAAGVLGLSKAHDAAMHPNTRSLQT